MNDDLLYRRIGPAARCPQRSLCEFPYLARPEHGATGAVAIRADINLFLTENWNALIALVKRRCKHLNDADVEDLVQDVAIHLAAHSIPRFNQFRSGSQGHPLRLVTFCWICGARYLSGEHRRAQTQRRRFVEFGHDHQGSFAKAISREGRHDRAIEKLAGSVVADPERYFYKRQAAYFSDCLTFPDSRVRERAKRLGYKQDSSATMIGGRMRETIVRLAGELA